VRAASNGDFFEDNASGQAVYEDMVIHPEAVRVGSEVFAVYQGLGLAPYIAVFHDGGGIDGPYRIGVNPLAQGKDMDDSHGAPAILVDTKRGVIHVFYGAHGTTLMHATAKVSSPSRWSVTAMPLGPVTYPQVFTDASGTAHIFYRKHAPTASDPDNLAWWHAVSSDGGAMWRGAKQVLLVSSGRSWYVHFTQGADLRIHMIATTASQSGTPLARSLVYYAWLDPAVGRWRDAKGTAVGTAGKPLVLADLASTSTACAIPLGGDANQNGVTASDDGSGTAGLLYVSGGQAGPDALRWTFAHWNGSQWATSTIASTDFLMDSGTLEYRQGGIDAYLTVGGAPSYVSQDPYAFRGGDIVDYRSTDGGASWAKVATIATAQPDSALMYNDPQIVEAHTSGGPRLLFSEWDNDAGAVGHKVYMWGPDGFRGRDFQTGVSRMAGTTRYDTAVAISKMAFPNGSDTAVVASGDSWADALAAGPLAEAYHAPLLLVPKNGATSAMLSELRRLKVRTVIVVGGPGSVPNRTTSGLDVAWVTKVRRISGSDRYGTAAAVAAAVKAESGRRGLAFVASGESFADGLCASTLAASCGAPVLLARRDSVPPATLKALASLGVTATIATGGPATISDTTLGELPSPTRVSGADRYAVAANVAALGLEGTAGVPPTLRPDRMIVASGDSWTDALLGASLGARLRAPLLLTKGNRLPGATSDILKANAAQVLNCYVIGGSGTVNAATARAIAGAFGG